MSTVQANDIKKREFSLVFSVHGLQCYGCNVIHGQKYVDVGCSKPEIITCTHSHKGFKHRFCIKTESSEYWLQFTIWFSLLFKVSDWKLVNSKTWKVSIQYTESYRLFRLNNVCLMPLSPFCYS